MNAPDLNNQTTNEATGGNEDLAHQPARESYDVAAALNLVSETAAAIKAFDEQAARSLMRAHEVADAVKEELARAELRAERVRRRCAWPRLKSSKCWPLPGPGGEACRA
ncbi:hypothetical protein IYY11_02385 [Methylocystis sp. H62]|uniref:hypothetical protein n=1 Tax=Methylocystis sp. H62 TaxID=2785789 RepID=UPI0018C349B0|nr:hypothetical protein [Methylocystis sp. H62]MBG0792312.1 hypothetical protein [Methylocystis sp. H62]